MAKLGFMALFILVLGQAPADAASRNILVTGFWPPTNEMLRKLSPKRELNPDGWQGKNWNGSGYDVYAYFPTYPDGGAVGVGDFRVDFAAAYNDFMFYTNELKPVAVVSFGQGAGPWEIENRFPAYFTNWFVDGRIPSEVGVTAQLPISERLKKPVEYNSSLPMQAIADAVNSVPGKPVRAWIDQTGGPGDFLCGFLAYLNGWYHAEHSSPSDPAYNAMAGFIHVNTDAAAAEKAAFATLNAMVTALPKP